MLNKRKKIITVLFMMFLMCINNKQFITEVFAEQNSNQFQDKLNNSMVIYIDSSKAYVNGDKAFIDESICPLIKDGRTLVPIRFIAEKLGSKVEWNAKTSCATITLNQNQISLTVGSNKAIVNGRELSLDVPAQIINGRTFIPLRVLSESLDKKIFWDDRGLIIIYNSENKTDYLNDKELINKLVESYQVRGNTVGNTQNYGEIAEQDG